jgi:hypothetical protein
MKTSELYAAVEEALKLHKSRALTTPEVYGLIKTAEALVRRLKTARKKLRRIK